MKTTSSSLMAGFTPHRLAAAKRRSRASIKRLIGFLLSGSLFLAGLQADQPEIRPGCHNPVKPLPCDCEDPRCTAANPVDAAASNVMRNVRDLEVFGGVGEHQLQWTRYGHSRTINGAAWFGDGHTWRHSYQWEMSSPGAGQLEINYPDGTDYTYTFSGGAWTGLASNPDVLTQSGSNYYLRRKDGFTYHFGQYTSGGQTYYLMQDFADTFGAVYNLTYDSSNRVTLITEPGGRWLRVTYQDIPVNQSQFTTLYAQSAVPAAGWNTETVSNTQTFRYLRYFSTEPGSQESYGNVAEVEFYDTAGNKLTGTPFGSSPAWNNGSSTFDKVFDGDIGTFFDYASRHFGFAGIDLGAGNAKAIGMIRFFPRVGYEGRMGGANGEGRPSGCRFEGSNVAPVSESVIAKVEAGYGQTVTRTVQYNYATFADPALTSGWLTLSGASYGDGSQAQYVYQSIYAGQHPLLLSADDPRIDGTATRIKYEFWTSGYVMGEIYAEHDFASNQIISKFEGEGGDSFANTGRKITYANGGARHLALGGDNNVNSSTDEVGNTTSYTFAANDGFMVSKTDPLGHTTSYTRDAQGRLLSTTYADNSTESWTRDALGHVLTHTDERGYTTTWTRNSNGRSTRIDYPDGGYETFTYNGFGQVLTHRQTNGGVEGFAYDGRGLKTSWTDALAQTTTYSYDINDLFASVTDPLNHATVYAHNERGQTIRITYADNNSISYDYDAYGNRLSSTNELSKTWSATYDAYRRKVTVTDPLNRTTQYWYDEPGSGSSGCGGCGSGLGGTGNHLTTIILPSGKTIKVGYDLAWRRIYETTGYNTPSAATTNYIYDSANNLFSIADPRGKITTYAYDVRNRRASATDPLGNITSWTYDAAGNAATDKRANNGITYYAYDPMNRLSQVRDPLNQVTKVTYDTTGSVITLTDASNNIYGLSYDLRNRKTRMSYPDFSHEDQSYDAAGNIATYSNRASKTKTLTYDIRNRKTDVVWNDGVTPEVTTSYDAAGQILTLNNVNSALSYTYDNAGQLSSETQNITGGHGTKTVAYTYDADGNRAQLTNPDGTAVTYAYTMRNQLSSVSLGGPPPLATYTYDLAGNTTVKGLEDSTTATYTYDDSNRLTSLVHQKSSVTLASFAYAYNNVNDRTSVTYASGLSDIYDYDGIDQITGAQYRTTNPANSPTNTQSTQGYAYDGVGNRTSFTQNSSTVSYSTNNLNQYTQVGPVSETYDGNGNLNGPVSGFTYTYDAQNRLISILTTTGGGTGNVIGGTTTYTFTYDACDRCVKRTVSLLGGVQQTSITNYLYDGWNLVAELNGDTGSQTASYVHGAKVDELLVRTNNNGTWYYHHDGLGSTVALTNTSGQVVEQYTYDVFGTPSVRDNLNQEIGGTAYGNRFLFTGREWLSSVGSYDYRNRMYSPALGRFLQIDPIRFKGGDFNLYRYVGNNPAFWQDAFGYNPDYPRWGGNPPPIPYRPVPSRGNCWRFVCNNPTDDPNKHSPTPGDWRPVTPGPGHDPDGKQNCPSLMRAVKSKGATDIDCKGNCPPGATKITVQYSDSIMGPFGPQQDVHFSEQDPNGQWHDKPGNTPPRDLPNSDPSPGYVKCGELCLPNGTTP